jgi:hypothetical protein
MERRIYTRKEIVKGGGAALAGATLALPLVPRQAQALTRGVTVGVFPNGNGPLYGHFDQLKRYIDLAGGVRPRIISVFSPWRDGGYLLPSTTNLRTIYKRYPGSVVMWTWEPFGVTLEGINSGTHNAYIDRVARRIKAARHRVLVRFGHEMNVNQAWPWVRQPMKYRAAWRRVVNRFRRVGARNAEWVWSPNVMHSGGALDFRPYYPGGAYVDWAGLDGYNWGALHRDWQSFRGVFEYSLSVIKRLSPKEIIICETGCHSVGGNKGAWFDGMRHYLKNDQPRVKGLVYSHMRDTFAGADWRVNSPDSALNDWRAFVADPQFKRTLIRP